MEEETAQFFLTFPTGQLEILFVSAGCPYRKPHPASEQRRIGPCWFPMIDFLRLLACALTRLFRSRARLEAEILVLRHQLNVLRRKAPERVAFSSVDRLVFAGLYRLVPGVLDALKSSSRKR